MKLTITSKIQKEEYTETNTIRFEDDNISAKDPEFLEILGMALNREVVPNYAESLEPDSPEAVIDSSYFIDMNDEQFNKLVDELPDFIVNEKEGAVSLKPKTLSRPKANKLIGGGVSQFSISELMNPKKPIQIKIECPECHFKGVRRRSWQNKFVECPGCTKPLFIRSATANFGIPDEYGNIGHAFEEFLPAKEREKQEEPQQTEKE